MTLKIAGLDPSTSEGLFLPGRAGREGVTGDNSVLSAVALQGQVTLGTEMTPKPLQGTSLTAMLTTPGSAHA